MTKNNTPDGFVNRRQRLIAGRRREKVVEALAEHYMEIDPDLSLSKATIRAEEFAKEEGDKNPHFDGVFLATEPPFRMPARSRTCPVAEMKAISDLPEMSWLLGEMKAAKTGRPANREMVVAALRKMSFYGRPDLLNTYREFSSNPGLAWAHGDPEVPSSLSKLYDQLKSFARRMPSGMVIHANLALIERIANLKDRRTGKLLFPNAFKYCAVDGTLIEADVPQGAPRGRSQRERKVMERSITGPETRMVQFVWYSHSSGSVPEDGPVRPAEVSKKCFGWKLVVVCCIDTGTPIIWTLIPASGDERIALRELIKSLYVLRPDFPMEYIVGDGLYSMSKEIFDFIEPKYGITTVFPRIKNQSTSKKWSKTDGVPWCKHGLMKNRGTQQAWRVRTRIKRGVRPGNLPPLRKWEQGHIRWTCKVRNGRRCPEVQTYFKWDRHLYTFLPHMGGCKKAALRSVLQARRNRSESVFSQMKHSGAGARWPNRARWATDDGMRWLTSMAMVQITARRLIHLDGSYEKALDRTRDEGLLNPSDERTFYALVDGREPLASEPVDGAVVEQPETWGIDADLPIDREYILPSLEEFSTKIDRE